MTEQKVTQDHLARNAYLYIRQSTLHQVMENRESTERQYALKSRAQSLGWHPDQVVVIDNDLGLSGASSEERKGFQRLVADVGLGRAGIVMGLEVSRLARNNADWHRLLEICGMARTLILDEDGLYDPGQFNDRLLLGLKGTMSEAELHFLRARLRGGILNKARKGELPLPLPVGYVYDDAGKQVLDPDQKVRDAVNHVFATFKRTGSACAVVRHFRENGLFFPSRGRGASRSRELVWIPLTHHRVLGVLHNPRYAGAYAFGRTRYRKDPSTGKGRSDPVSQDQWSVFLPGAHEGYIRWEEYLENRRKLLENALAHGKDRKRGPPREGPALLQGIVMCGKCGERMTVRYRSMRGTWSPLYMCQRRGIETATPFCQIVATGSVVDDTIGKLLLETMTPLNIEVAMEVFEEIRSRREEVVRMHQRRLEQIRHDAEMARRRFLRVNPENRLVADNLERDWNEKLRAVTAVEDECARVAKDRMEGLSAEQADRIRRLAEDFPAVWRDPRVSAQDKKRMVRLLIEDVTLIKTDVIDVKVRFRGGATKELRVPIPPTAWEMRKATPALVERLREMGRTMTVKQIAAQLNAEGVKSPTGRAFNRNIMHRLRHAYGIEGPYASLRERGLLTRQEIAQRLDISPATVGYWTKLGLLKAHRYDDRRERLYEDPGPARPVKGKWKKRPAKGRLTTKKACSDVAGVVQIAA